MPSRALVLPNADLVIQANERFDHDERFAAADRILSRVFSHHPQNDRIDDVLMKVVLLNGLYNTNVFAVMEMAAHIRRLAIDESVSVASTEVVGRIAALTIRTKTRRHYSFATKYCSWHRPEEYPIYDSLVERLLWLYQRQTSFSDFRRPQLQEYEVYKGVISVFREHFLLQQFTFRQLDKFLWLTSKDLLL